MSQAGSGSPRGAGRHRLRRGIQGNRARLAAAGVELSMAAAPWGRDEAQAVGASAALAPQQARPQVAMAARLASAALIAEGEGRVAASAGAEQILRPQHCPYNHQFQPRGLTSASAAATCNGSATAGPSAARHSSQVHPAPAPQPDPQHRSIPGYDPQATAFVPAFPLTKSAKKRAKKKARSAMGVPGARVPQAPPPATASGPAAAGQKAAGAGAVPAQATGLVQVVEPAATAQLAQPSASSGASRSAASDAPAQRTGAGGGGAECTELEEAGGWKTVTGRWKSGQAATKQAQPAAAKQAEPAATKPKSMKEQIAEVKTSPRCTSKALLASNELIWGTATSCAMAW